METIPLVRKDVAVAKIAELLESEDQLASDVAFYKRLSLFLAGIVLVEATVIALLVAL